MPRLWDDTIAAHRQAVREAILDTTWRLVGEHGLLSVTMSQVAEETGIGRATLYKYFPDVEEILLAWHERHVGTHLSQLNELSEGPGDARDRLRSVFERYAMILHHQGQHVGDLAGLLHRGDHVARAQDQLVDLFLDLLVEAAASGEVRADVAPQELSTYCLHALAAARNLRSEAAVHRLVTVTMTGLAAERPDARAIPSRRARLDSSRQEHDADHPDGDAIGA